MYRYIFDVLPPKCTGTFLTYQNGLNVQYIFGGPPPLRGGDVEQSFSRMFTPNGLGIIIQFDLRIFLEWLAKRHQPVNEATTFYPSKGNHYI